MLRAFEFEENGTILFELRKSTAVSDYSVAKAGETILMESDVRYGYYKSPSVNSIPLSIPILLEAATPSPFGFKENTVFDETVRLGKELSAERMTITLSCESRINEKVSKALFGGRNIELKFYKLALYEPGGMS